MRSIFPRSSAPFRKHGWAPLLLGSALLVACSSQPEASAEGDALAAATPQGAFWDALQAHCGQAFGGQLTEGGQGDTTFSGKALVMHVRECSDSTIHIPFHVGEDRSRTWVVTRTDSGLRLKHDHRQADGSEDDVTQYGGDTRDEGTADKQEFYADAFTAELIPPASTNIWTMEVVQGERFAYGLRREGTDRRFRVEFDLKETVPVPPAPWGWED